MPGMTILAPPYLFVIARPLILSNAFHETAAFPQRSSRQRDTSATKGCLSVTPW
jgi:hypothetical protein